MEQLSFFSVPSPCIGVCQTDARGYCNGCLRNRDERFNWLHFSDAQKHNIIRLCQQRKRRRQYAKFKAHQIAIKQQQAQANPQFDFDEQTDDDNIDLADFSLD
ncbi:MULTISPECIES: DUF1289 domain-containing protein [unclassified Shewanella]|uniref:DUF1289 domain-containing protein n=1 Tax=unclassified Shewanella TaxID=196818 RepID=UPI000C83658E|nr:MULTISPECIES: DUF1289 domain-containing protein [unclassified Shewanella]MDO6619202.1 DUF1289 domain-containing protein [Shewanella sp. 6_MG-2023]MDO6638872.1 DUF1289 domain-containing protein [Shewanella sp. 5_MG-2023]MDO6677228.1 DUF1289 domain-containing protein [Shewanella sp. 4_MG-2023]MDO6773890.1 DUF1289 domain-containing protein [Shewanella sp. 3_MG-2023]PMG31589.1 hypothetical protein BCU94_07605 [Shewanella sp. 10N.286.52.C2]